MDSSYYQEKFHQLLQNPGVLVGIIAGAAVFVAIIVFVVVVMVRKRRILHKQAYATSMPRDHGHDTHDKKRLVSESSSHGGEEVVPHPYYPQYLHREGVDAYKVTLIDEVKVAKV